MIIGLFGLSGSGKSSLRYAFAEKHPDFYCTSASEILKNSNRPIALESLNINELDTNQSFLVNMIKNLASTHNDLFIELHAIIENKSDEPYTVDKTTLESINLDYIFILDISADEILKHRINDLNRKRPSISREKIIKLSKLQNKYLNQIYPNKLKFIKNLKDIEDIVFM
jgi:adenylate kinase